MARKFGPFDTSQFFENENRRMQRAFNQITGFVRGGQGAVSLGAGAQLVIAAYPDGALVDGLYVENPASETVTLTTNTASTSPRIDRLVMRLDMNAKTIAPFQIVGTPAATPTAPALTQTSTVYDMPLCQYRFPGSASAQNPGSLINEGVTLPAATAAGFLGEADGPASGTAGDTNTEVATVTVTVPAGLASGRRIQIDGLTFLDTPAGVGAVLTLTASGNRTVKTRSIQAGSLYGDFMVFGFDSNLTAGSRAYTLEVRTTVAGQTLTYRSPHISAKIV